MKIYLNSYYPTEYTNYGKEALKKFPELHPLEDGSIRREPDFTSKYPGISGLCRPGKMNDIGLKAGDIIVYKTNGSHKLTAILKVIERLESHLAAKDWFDKKAIEVPSNCILMQHLPIEKSHAQKFLDKVGKSQGGNKVIAKKWDKDYQIRATDPKSSYFFITESIYNAVRDKKKEFVTIGDILRRHSNYGKVHNTSIRPIELTEACYNDILKLT